MNSKSRLKEVMTRLGGNDSVDDDLCGTLGEFACTMYGDRRAKDVNTLRFKKFTEKQNRENKYLFIYLFSIYLTLTNKLHF